MGQLIFIALFAHLYKNLKGFFLNSNISNLFAAAATDDF